MNTNLKSDARLWVDLMHELADAGVQYPNAADRHARRAVAIVRRHRLGDKARTFGPGDEVPYDVTRAYDLDGDIWERQSADPASTARDLWKMPGFDPDQHESACGGAWVTPYLLDEYGPLTEAPAGSRKGRTPRS